MRHELNEDYSEEIPVENNSHEEQSKISLPDNWWSSQNSYEMFSKRNVKIVRFNESKISSRINAECKGWDIKNGDFIGEFINEKRILTKKEKERLNKFFLFGFIIIASAVIILISYGIAETIHW